MKSTHRFLCMLLMALTFTSQAKADAPASSKQKPNRTSHVSSMIGQKVQRLELSDFRGKRHTLKEYQSSKIVVIAFLGTECPLAKLYGPRLSQMAEKYASQNVQFLGINSNVQDSITEMTAYARIHKISFPMLKDPANRFADRLKAERTPEVFVLDEARKIRYRGKIDDQWGVGYVKAAAQQHDLRDAIDTLLAGKEISIPVTKAVGCHIGRVLKPVENAAVTYCNQISRILQTHCVECHRKGDIAPFQLTDYDEVVGWAEMIAEVVEERRMPPWHADPKVGHFSNDISLSQEERSLIFKWVSQGAPKGDLNQLPKQKEYVLGWQLPERPDVILDVSEEPFQVKAEGEIRYQWFTVDPGFKEDKWLKAAEILPGNRSVVHHILAFTKQPGERRRFSEREGFLVGYVPGLRAKPFPKGMAKLIPAGSQLVFQVHYTPVGSEQSDQSKIGLSFADPGEVTHIIQTSQAINTSFEIPAHAANYEVKARSAASPRDVLLLGFMPHMHLRGKSYAYEAHYPDGTQEMLLNVPRYDFNWQTAYRLEKPKRLPKGTRIHCVAHFDNSEDNLNNPNPNIKVRWGDQTWEEMMLGYFDIAWSRNEDAEETKIRTLFNNQKSPKMAAERILSLLDKNGNGTIEKKEVKPRMLPAFLLIDRNRDSVVTPEELTTAIEAKRKRQKR